MASITGKPVLTITPGLQTWTINVKYNVKFDLYDVASDQPYYAHIHVKGDDTGTGDGAAAGPDDLLLAWVPAQVRFSSGTAYSHTLDVAPSTLNEDTGEIPNPDEIIALVSLAPLAPATFGPVESTMVTLTL